MKNILTVDLEDWFSVEALNEIIEPDDWDGQESVVIVNTHKILNLFCRHNVKATFFVLGWVADRYPDLINEVAAAGHEIACHSFQHHMVSSLTPDEFQAGACGAI
jgi:peptidoglycan/xylan/chitin deacetylase (PgdA/CDA1 family)